ncbi:hypothetical protein OH799_33665 [Nocardia sp. NBC_00881]|uniref:hypothetical protein n=1 Tax=Nocardia sp. NBC_00881 TaxID=2975995 RepID=UPI003863FBBE|nr:hypothetical protein OH799_33665 [Nocardia sp. NBC_00881]
MRSRRWSAATCSPRHPDPAAPPRTPTERPAAALASRRGVRRARTGRHTTVKRRNATVEITSEGHNAEQLADDERRIAVVYDADVPSKTIATAVFAGLALVMVVFASGSQQSRSC